MFGCVGFVWVVLSWVLCVVAGGGVCELGFEFECGNGDLHVEFGVFDCFRGRIVMDRG